MSDAEKADTPQTVTFHHLKSDFHRVIHVDGAFGGPTPSGLLHMAVFSNRLPIPKSVTHSLEEGGTIGDEIERDSRQGVVREIEVGLVMTPATALALAKWLVEKAAVASASVEKMASGVGDATPETND